MQLTPDQLLALASRFAPGGVCEAPVPYGEGHINDTYLFSTREDGHTLRLTLQRVNRTAFPRPDEVMENTMRVTDHLRRRIAREGGDPDRETLTLRHTPESEWFVLDDYGDLWRSCLFVEDALTYNQTDEPSVFRAAGEAFGRFQRLLEDFDATLLHETIVDFHHTPKRFAAFRRAIQEDRAGRLASVAPEVEYALSQEGFASALIDARAEGALPLRVTHNDTKLNNVLIDRATRRGLCVIDLDTVMPGLSAYDFGDAIRFGANTAAEDERDLTKVRFSLPMYNAYAEGYLSQVGPALTEAELRSLPVGAKMMTLECGTRFLTDYLAGDTYFKIAYPEHNLVRARNQFALLRDMDAHWDEMQHVIKR